MGENRSCELRASDEPNYPSKRHQRIRICLSREVKSSFSLTRRQAPTAKYPEKVERRPDRIPDVRYSGGMSDATCRKGSFTCQREREPRQFLGRIPQLTRLV